MLRHAVENDEGVPAHRQIPENILSWTPRRLSHLAKATTTKEAARMQVPSASTLGSLAGKRSWLQM